MPEKVAGAAFACACADNLFLNFLLLFVSRQKVKCLKGQRILYLRRM